MSGTDRMVWYLDTSAAVKLIRSEAETAALVTWVRDRPVVSSDLLRTELRRAVGDDLALAAADELLDAIPLVSITPDTFDTAGRLDGHLRSLDALHLTIAIELGDDLEALVTYDRRLTTAAGLHDISVVAPA